ncbi:MAG: hypothetical protein Q9217_001009 [Psora testacea]
MVHLASTAILGLTVLVLGVSAAPANNTSSVNVITLKDVQGSTPDIPEVTDPAEKAISSEVKDDSILLQARPDLADKVNDAKKEIPSLLADDSIPKPESNISRRDLEKRANEECYVFTKKPPSPVQATPAALAWAVNHACKRWFPKSGIYYVPEGSARYAYYFNHLVVEYHVRRTSSPYKWPVKEYYAVSQEVCISQLSGLVLLAKKGFCAGDMSGVTSKKDLSVPIWYSWRTY